MKTPSMPVCSSSSQTQYSFWRSLMEPEGAGDGDGADEGGQQPEQEADAFHADRELHTEGGSRTRSGNHWTTSLARL